MQTLPSGALEMEDPEDAVALHGGRRPAARRPAARPWLTGRRLAGLALCAACACACAVCAYFFRPRPAAERLAVLSREEVPGVGQPQYARVNGSIETLWQRPAGEPKGIFFIAHGCMHQAPDVFHEFEACKSSYFGRCLGLPEEVHLRHAALARGYLVMAVSGGAGKQSCWLNKDLFRIKAAVKHVLHAEGLSADTPVLASGASSGGGMVGILATPAGLPHLKCIVPQVSSTESLTWGNAERKIPALYVHMPQDGYTMDMVEDDYLALKGLGARTAKIEVKPRPVTAAFLERCLSKGLAEEVAVALQKEGILDGKGFLKEDARNRKWVPPVSKVIKGRSDDTLVADESCLSERMNVAWAFHEFTAQYAEDMLDFCEEKGKYAKDDGQPAKS